MLDQKLRDGRKIISNDSPPNPAFHPCVAMSQTAIQTSGAAQLTDAAFNPIAETLGRPKPGLLLVSATPVRLVTRLGQAHSTNAQDPRFLFIAGRVNAPITADLLGRFAKQLAVTLHTGNQILGFVRIAHQEAVLANQPALDFPIPNLAPELSLFRFSFAATDNRRVRFKQTHDLVAGG